MKDDDSHFAVTRLVSLKTPMMAALSAEVLAAAAAAREAELGVHLDGARFFNAITALGCAAPDLAGLADTISVCLSKGLGTPAGSVLVGTQDRSSGRAVAERCWAVACASPGFAAGFMRWKTTLRGSRTITRARSNFPICCRVSGPGRLRRTPTWCSTPADRSNDALRSHMAAKGVVIGGGKGAIRMVLHKDVDDAALDHASEGLRSFYGG